MSSYSLRNDLILSLQGLPEAFAAPGHEIPWINRLALNPRNEGGFIPPISKGREDRLDTAA